MTAIDIDSSSNQTESFDSDGENDADLDSNGSDVEDDEISNESSGENSNELANAGWADAVSKILKTKQKGKTLVLSKAKKLTDPRKVQPKPVGFEVETPEGEVKKEVIVEGDIKSEEPPRKKKKELPKSRVKPNILEKDRERLLQKIATKGVVHLFNAVRSQQKDINEKLEQAGPLEVRKEKPVDRVLGETKKEKKNASTRKDSTWSVLKEDFMMGAKMKDWDKELENEEESEKEIEIDSD
ncbi:hypothetical protein JTB14_013661 [Gonioctena quinquepunctata]|nr:hypothetical protein JTB14_013661 [Gonioctena quinquepunctata]